MTTEKDSRLTAEQAKAQHAPNGRLYDLFEFFIVEHDLTLIDTEIMDIIDVVKEHLKLNEEEVAG